MWLLRAGPDRRRSPVDRQCLRSICANRRVQQQHRASLFAVTNGSRHCPNTTFAAGCKYGCRSQGCSARSRRLPTSRRLLTPMSSTVGSLTRSPDNGGVEPNTGHRLNRARQSWPSLNACVREGRRNHEKPLRRAGQELRVHQRAERGIACHAIQCQQTPGLRRRQIEPWHFHILGADSCDHVREGNMRRWRLGCRFQESRYGHEKPPIVLRGFVRTESGMRKPPRYFSSSGKRRLRYTRAAAVSNLITDNTHVDLRPRGRMGSSRRCRTPEASRSVTTNGAAASEASAILTGNLGNRR
jgi:hypothetical protein